MQVGDWVTGYNKGLFKVEKIVKQYYDECHVGGILDASKNKLGDEISDPLVVLKKGFSGSYKPQISWDVCAQSLCIKVSPEDLEVIEETLNDDEKFRKKFDSYIIPPYKSLLNIGFNSRNSTGLINKIDDIKAKIIDGMTYSEIKAKLNSDLKFELPHNQMIQIINFDFEINENKQIIFREIGII
ncbi:hypothetical protein ACFO9Q_04910 [Paenibacillus sp. GCM10023252]|uniref:hypothetical protein n=1 Tax=Paenibacillus sp. GCM10023252 TaxID=3252649 RepID=UPI00360BFACF